MSVNGTIHSQAVINGEGVNIGVGSNVDAGAVIQGPVLIGKNVFIGHGAFVRPYTIIGDDCIVGHCCEVKDSIIFPRSSIPHFNFVGNSIIGTDVNLGGGTIVSNFELGVGMGTDPHP